MRHRKGHLAMEVGVPGGGGEASQDSDRGGGRNRERRGSAGGWTNVTK